MLTRWGRALDPAAVLPEHPRPHLRRDGWVNLNGVWRYAFATERRPASWDGDILVPFSPEAPLSGVGRQLQPEEYLWYRLDTTCPPLPPQGALWLHFGAVDQHCVVWVNGVEVTRHTGGYLPFSCDITAAAAATSTADSGAALVIEVRVQDFSETAPHARGKQRLDRGNIWYTAQSGIWQTVWLEVVGPHWIQALPYTADTERGQLTFNPQVATTAATADAPTDQRRVDPSATASSATAGATPSVIELEVWDGDQLVGQVAGSPDAPLTVTLAHAKLWSPASPHLYTVKARYGADEVTSYAALRSLGVTRLRSGRRWLTLNGEPIQHVGVLDQGYWPGGLLTPPADEAMVFDITTIKELGFNAVRKHAKIEPSRWYYHCDRLGLLVWQDMVNGGGRYRALTTKRPARQPVRIPDRFYSLYLRQDAAGRAEFIAEMQATVAALGQHPCIVAWTIFNEGWGQFDAKKLTKLLRRWDPSRPINSTSGWVDQGCGDIRSFHSYLKPFRLAHQRWWGRFRKRVLALTEYGGYSLRVPGHDWSEKKFGYRHYDTETELLAALATLHAEQILPAITDGIAATFYTQLTDVEEELNGLLTWDREVVKGGTAALRELITQLYPTLPR